MKKKLIIFDLDGTLLYTLEDLYLSVNHFLNVFHYPTVDKEHVRKSIGNGVAKLTERCLPNGLNNPDYEDCLKEFRRYYKLHSSDHTKRYPYMLSTLKILKKRHYLLAVVTNKTHEVAMDLMNQFYPNIFDYVQGDIPSLKKKPHPDMVNEVINKSHIERKDIIYIGDTEVDYQVARNAEIEASIVTYGYRNKEEIDKLDLGNSILITSPKELLHLFE